MRVFIVDDHVLVRRGIASLLETREGYQVVGEASTGEEALELVPQARPDVVLMDVKMPGMGGIEAVRQLLETHPDLKVVMLSVVEDEEALVEAVRAGAKGYISKNARAEEFFELLEAVATGQVAVSRALAGRLLEEFVRGPRERGGLTEAERKVLALVAEGARNPEIARRLFISENTVKYHLRNIMAKLQARTRAEAVAKAVKDGLLPPRQGEGPGA